MLVINIRLVIVSVFVFTVSTYAQRRIKDGHPISSEKNYVVYLLKAPVSPQKYDAWLCGGALVSTVFIITSAACVEDVQHLYAIAGYSKYVAYEMMQLDACTREKKKKIIFICVPKGYDLDYARLEKWSYSDIAVVKVESPYNFQDKTYQQICSYIPAAIKVNFYDKRYQETGVETLTYGWGHADIWRSPNDGANYNQENLHYATAVIQDAGQCKSYYTKFKDLTHIIDKYMICTMDPGNLNDAGELQPVPRPTKLLEGCVTRMQRMRGLRGVPCREGDGDEAQYDDETQHIDETHQGGEIQQFEDTLLVDETRRQFNMSQYNFRRNGICQNDHGGPLVTWVGAHEVLIGVASVFRVNNESKCTGPYLYSSTQCSGAFLECVLNNPNGRRYTSCDAPASVKGFDIIETPVSWIGHPDGPAENEINHSNVEESQKQSLQTQPEVPKPDSSELPFSELQIPGLGSVEHEAAEQQLSETPSQDTKLPETKSPEQQLWEQPLPYPQSTEKRKPNSALRAQESSEQKLPDRQLWKQVLRDQKLPEKQPDESDDIQLDELLPGLHLSESRLPAPYLQEIKLEQRHFQPQNFDSLINDGEPSEEPFNYFKSKS